MKLWVASKPADEVFNWMNGLECAAAQYRREHGELPIQAGAPITAHPLSSVCLPLMHTSRKSSSPPPPTGYFYVLYTPITFGELHDELVRQGW